MDITEVEIVEDVEMKDGHNEVNVPREMVKAVLPYVIWTVIVVVGFRAISRILDTLII